MPVSGVGDRRGACGWQSGGDVGDHPRLLHRHGRRDRTLWPDPTTTNKGNPGIKGIAVRLEN